GSTALSSLYTQLQIVYHEKDVVADDAAIGHCKLAYQHALQGQYDRAIDILDLVKEQFGHEHGALYPWAQCLGQILHQRAYFREERVVASGITRWLRTVMDENTPMGSDAEYREVLNGLQCGDVVNAVDKLYKMIDKCKEDGNGTITHQNQTQYLLKFAEFHLKSGNPIPALPLILTCLTLSEKFHVMEDFYMTKIRLAEVFLCLGLANNAVEIIDDIMSQVLSTGSLHLQSITHLAYAKGLYAQFLTLEKEGKEDKHQLKAIIKFLQKANVGFERLECIEETLECVYLQSRIHHQMGSIGERNKFAQKYRKLTRDRSLAIRKFDHLTV
ncbi:APC5 protein, partial [Basidiobolus ranarum]